jgi:DNA-binding MarR family transcriptional regulator
MKEETDGERCVFRAQHGLTAARHRAYGALLRAHAAVISRIEELSKAEGALPPEWYDILLALEYSPEGRLRVGELACHVTLSRSGLTRLVDKLEAAGLVDRQLNPNDRRSFEVILTTQGRAERERTWPMYARIIAEVFGSQYSDEEATLLAQLLKRQFTTGEAASCDAKSGVDQSAES